MSQSPAYDSLVAHHRRVHDLEHLQDTGETLADNALQEQLELRHGPSS